MRPAPSRRAPTPRASNANGAARSARSKTASSPSTSASPAAATRPCSMPTCSCPSPGTRTATAAAQAGIPDDVVYRPKWQIALEQIDRARANGIALDWLTFDEGYGDKPGFLQGLEERHRSATSARCPSRSAASATRPRRRQAGPPGRRPGAAQPAFYATAVATLPAASADGGGAGVGGEGGAGVAVFGWRRADATG